MISYSVIWTIHNWEGTFVMKVSTKVRCSEIKKTLQTPLNLIAVSSQVKRLTFNDRCLYM